MGEILNDLTVVIPFIADDLLWKDLLQDLKPLPAGAEILLVGPDAPDAEIFARATADMLARVRYVPSARGRGVQMNTGARAALKNFFWFLHADSKVPRPSIFLLQKALATQPVALHYFDLQFLGDGPALVRLNSVVANLRSRYLQLPQGNQGFAVSRATFYRIGGFVENVAQGGFFDGHLQGEDHAFVWEARRKRVPLSRVPGAIFTSARRYENEGWGVTTGRRALFTARRTAHECVKLFKQRILESRRSIAYLGRPK